MNELLAQLADLVDKHQDKSTQERNAACVLACLRGCLLSGADSELADMCVEFSKYQIAVINETMRRSQ